LCDQPEEKEAVDRARHEWKDNIKMDHKDIGYGWIQVAHDRVKSRALIHLCFIKRCSQFLRLCSINWWDDSE
jgi:hypothetical protein